MTEVILYPEVISYNNGTDKPLGAEFLRRVLIVIVFPFMISHTSSFYGGLVFFHKKRKKERNKDNEENTQ